MVVSVVSLQSRVQVGGPSNTFFTAFHNDGSRDINRNSTLVSTMGIDGFQGNTTSSHRSPRAATSLSSGRVQAATQVHHMWDHQ